MEGRGKVRSLVICIENGHLNWSRCSFDTKLGILFFFFVFCFVYGILVSIRFCYDLGSRKEYSIAVYYFTILNADKIQTGSTCNTL